MRTIVRESVAVSEGWVKITLERSWDFVNIAHPWCHNHVSTGKFCSVDFGKVWYFSKSEDAVIFKLKFG